MIRIQRDIFLEARTGKISLNGGIISTFIHFHIALSYHRSFDQAYPPTSPDDMTTARPLGRLYTTARQQHNASASPRLTLRILALQTRHYAQKPASNALTQSSKPDLDPVKSALDAISGTTPLDPINPPASTRPPPLTLPTRGDENAAIYWYRFGRAYGTFYKDGVKAVWYNYRAASLLKQRLQSAVGQAQGKDVVTEAIRRGLIERSEFQLLARNRHDIGKLPFFGVLVATFGEWLPLIVPFIPNAVPSTCRIPKQVRQMREKAEERRKITFRSGVDIPSHSQLQKADEKRSDQDWALALSPSSAATLLTPLALQQLHFLSTTFSLHSSLWDRVNVPPPAALLRRWISGRLTYLAQDDYLLLKHKKTVEQLSEDELLMACEERGLDILPRREEKLREALQMWLKLQKKDEGRGRAMVEMSFRRPSVWENIKLKES